MTVALRPAATAQDVANLAGVSRSAVSRCFSGAGRVSKDKRERILAAAYAGSMGIVARRFPERVMHALGAVLTDGGLCDNSATADITRKSAKPPER